MIKAKEAVQIAQNQIREWFTEEELLALELEEVSLSADERTWHVTLTHMIRRSNPIASELMSAPAGRSGDTMRTWKVFIIDAESGEVRSMKRAKTG